MAPSVAPIAREYQISVTDASGNVIHSQRAANVATFGSRLGTAVALVIDRVPPLGSQAPPTVSRVFGKTPPGTRLLAPMPTPIAVVSAHPTVQHHVASRM